MVNIDNLLIEFKKEIKYKFSMTVFLKGAN